MKNLVVLAAMDEEEAAIVALLSRHPSREAAYGRRIRVRTREYTVGPRAVILARTGLGSVNAALALAMIAEGREVDAVLLLGVGGALTPRLAMGDLVVSRRVLQHDSFASLDFGHARMAPGDIITRPEQLQGYTASTPADPRLVALLEAALPAGKVTVGTVVSGSEFVGTVARKLDLQALDPEAILVEMEGAGVAQLCRRIDLPFVVAKTVADRLHADGTIEADFFASLHAAAANAATVLEYILEHDPA